MFTTKFTKVMTLRTPPALRVSTLTPQLSNSMNDLNGARAFDFFGLWGSSETAPPVSREAISYAVTIDVEGGDKALASAVKDASSLWKQRQDAPPDGDTLARRATRDFAPVIDALWGLGYYNAVATISIDRASLTVGSSDIEAFSRAAERYRNRAVAPIAIKVAPGPLFKLRSIRILNSAGAKFSKEELPPRTVGVEPGGAAAASELRAAQVRIVDYFRSQGHPLAKIQSIAPVVDHAAHMMDVTVTAAPGPVAPFGEATIVGPQHFDPAIVRSFLTIQPGDPYSPQALAEAKTSLREIPAVGSVRITEGSALDPYGRLPYQIDVEDRLPYAVGVSAKYSSTNGPAGQAYWEDRNLFGDRSAFRLEADLFYAQPNSGFWPDFQRFSTGGLGGRLSASFLKPALWGTRNDLLLDALGERVTPAPSASSAMRSMTWTRQPPCAIASVKPSRFRRASKGKAASPRIHSAGSTTRWSAFPCPSPMIPPTASSTRRAAYGSTLPPRVSGHSSVRASTSCRSKLAPRATIPSTPTRALFLRGGSDLAP